MDKEKRYSAILRHKAPNNCIPFVAIVSVCISTVLCSIITKNLTFNVFLLQTILFMLCTYLVGIVANMVEKIQDMSIKKFCYIALGVFVMGAYGALEMVFVCKWIGISIVF